MIYVTFCSLFRGQSHPTMPCLDVVRESTIPHPTRHSSLSNHQPQMGMSNVGPTSHRGSQKKYSTGNAPIIMALENQVGDNCGPCYRDSKLTLRWPEQQRAGCYLVLPPAGLIGFLPFILACRTSDISCWVINLFVQLRGKCPLNPNLSYNQGALGPPSVGITE